MTRQGLTRCGKAGKVWHGSARLGRVGRCRRGVAWRCLVWLGKAGSNDAVT